MTLELMLELDFCNTRMISVYNRSSLERYWNESREVQGRLSDRVSLEISFYEKSQPEKYMMLKMKSVVC